MTTAALVPPSQAQHARELAYAEARRRAFTTLTRVSESPTDENVRDFHATLHALEVAARVAQSGRMEPQSQPWRASCLQHDLGRSLRRAASCRARYRRRDPLLPELSQPPQWEPRQLLQLAEITTCGARKRSSPQG